MLLVSQPLQPQLVLTKHLSIKFEMFYEFNSITLIFIERREAFRQQAFKLSNLHFPICCVNFNISCSPPNKPVRWLLPDATHCSHKKSINTQFPPMFRSATCARIIPKEFSEKYLYHWIKYIFFYSFHCQFLIQQLAAVIQ